MINEDIVDSLTLALTNYSGICVHNVNGIIGNTHQYDPLLNGIGHDQEL